MGKVIHLDRVGSAATSNIIGDDFTNYNDLIAQYPTAKSGSLAYVINSQGTAWLPGGLGGTFYSKGWYYYDGANWIDGVNEIAGELEKLKNKISNEFLIVYTIADLPTPISNVITLADNVTYYFINDLDLVGNRLVSGADTAILGASSENCSITSTGLGVGVPLLTSVYTTPIRHITFKDVDTCLDFDGLGGTMALDWTGVNFENIPNVGTLKDFNNFIFSKGAFLNSKGLIIDGTVGTIGVDNSIFVGSGAAGNIIDILPTCVVTRRFRIIYSAFVVFGSTTGINVDVSATIPTESYILDTVNFSGGATYLAGINDTSNKALFVNCVGITNVSANGQLYMQNNATITTVVAPSTFYKVLGTTIPSTDNSKFSHANNRLTCDAEVSRKYLIQCSVSFDSGNNNVCEFGFYDSQLATVRTPSRILATANSAGRAESVTFFCVVSMISGDFLEVHAANNTGANDITVTDMNFTITDIK